MEIKYIDIHSHLGFGDLPAPPAQAGQVGHGQDLKEVIKRMEEYGVATITVGTDLESSKEAVKIADEFENIWACIGAHPADNRNFVFEEKDFENLVKNPRVVAIGECGLDYFKLAGDIEAEKNRQKKEFIKQIEFSIKYNKPLMIHIRPACAGGDAYEDAYEILKKYEGLPAQVGKARGNMHFFAGSLDYAKKIIDLGFTISFTGVITFARQYDEIIKNIPLDKIHIETDSPFVAPVPYRGRRNEPAYVIEVVKRIAEIRGENFEAVRLQLLNNAKKTFNIFI